jgi:hypothetical protein
MARADALGLGFDVDAESRVIGADGAPSPALFAVGPLTKGALWEIVAVPDIRQQVRDVARDPRRLKRLTEREEPNRPLGAGRAGGRGLAGGAGERIGGGRRGGPERRAAGRRAADGVGIDLDRGALEGGEAGEGDRQDDEQGGEDRRSRG